MEQKIPKHVAIIMDGNGRWGDNRFNNRTAGHHAGVLRVKEIVSHAQQINLRTLTLWAFSTDNWNRPDYEVNVLLQLFKRYIISEAEELHHAQVRVTFIGEHSALPNQLQIVMQQLVQQTAANTDLHLQIAINYGGRDEILRAIRKLIKKTQLESLDADWVNEEQFTALLDTVGVPDPDLVIRTSGEYRTSGFMSWQATSSELYFSDCLWPDFTAAEFDKALAEYARRDRRFGGVSKQKSVQ